MKKVLLFAAFAVFAFTTSQAQEFRLGAKLGLNLASVGGDGTGGLGSRTSFHIGGLAEIPLMGKFALQPELLYSSEGFDYGGVLTSGSDLKLDYIRIPILAKYYIIEGLSAELGPQFGVLVSADNGGDVKKAYNSFDAGLAIGATYRLNMGVFFSLRYNKGLTNIYSDDYAKVYGDEPYYGGWYTTGAKSQSNVFQVSAGYSF